MTNSFPHGLLSALRANCSARSLVVEWSCGPIMPTSVCSARSNQAHARRSNSTIHVVVDRTSIMTAQAGCDLDCATSVGAQLNQLCACEVVDVFSLHESIRSAFPEFTAEDRKSTRLNSSH